MSFIPTSKKECKTQIWTAVDRNRGENVAFEIGDGSKSTYLKIAK